MPRGFDYETTLGTCWSKQDNNWRLYYPDRESGWELHDLLRSDTFKQFLEELEEQGFDTKTLRLSVKKKTEEKIN